MSKIKESYNMPKGFEKSFIKPRILVEFMLMSIIAGILWWKANPYIQLAMAVYWCLLIYYCLKSDYQSKNTKNNLDITLDYFAFKIRKKGDTTLNNQDYLMLKESLEKNNKRK